jgi:hypothetical protein
MKKIVSVKLLLYLCNFFSILFTSSDFTSYMYQRTSDSSMYLSSETGTLVSSIKIHAILFI